MANLTLVQAINLALIQEMEKDDRVILLGEDVGANGGVFRVTEGLQKRFGANRVVDTPLAESGIIGTSIGLAMAGLRPVPEIQFEGFLGPAYDQLCSHAARMRTRTRGAFTVPMTVRVPVGGGIHAPELHSDSPEAFYAHQPGLKVVMPSSPYDAKGLLVAAIRDVLGEAIEVGGTTLRDYVDPDGMPGYFGRKLFVYERRGKPCRRCGTPIRQFTQGSRSTYWCPNCQR